MSWRSKGGSSFFCQSVYSSRQTALSQRLSFSCLLLSGKQVLKHRFDCARKPRCAGESSRKWKHQAAINTFLSCPDFNRTASLKPPPLYFENNACKWSVRLNNSYEKFCGNKKQTGKSPSVYGKRRLQITLPYSLPHANQRVTHRHNLPLSSPGSKTSPYPQQPLSVRAGTFCFFS